MKRWISLLLVLCLALAMLPATAAAAAQKTEISVVAALYSEDTRDWWKNFEKEFEANNTSIDLVVDVYAWNEIYSVANTQISAGNSPDILNLDDFKTYQSDGMLLSADKFLSSKTYDKFYDVHLNAATVQGKVWAIPDLTSTSALYYNKELLKGAGVSVPTTWNGVLKACKALKETYGNDIIPWGVATAYENRIETAANYIWSNGGDFLDSNGCWNVNSDANVEALYYAAALYQEDYAGYLYTHNYELMDAFRAGDVAMMIGSDTFRYSMENGFYGISKIPANTGKIASAPVVMDYFMCFDNNQTDKEMSAIKKFFDAFYEDKTYVNWAAETEGFLPATTTGMDYLAKKDSTMSVWKQALETAKVYPSHKCNWSDAVEGMRSILTEVMKGGNAKELLDELNAKLLAGDVILDAPTAKTSRSSATGVVTVKWNKVSGATKYKVEYSTNKTTWKVLKSGTTSTSATHSGASIGTKYYYRVTALSANAVSEPSDVVSSTRKLAQPEIEVSNVASSGKIKVSWEKVDGAVEYEVYRADSKTGTYKLVKTTTSRSFTNTSATAGKTYYYKVKAIAEKSAGNSVDSEVKSRTCDLARPEVTLKNVASSGKIKVSWEKVDGAVEYEVYRATSKSGEYKLVKTTTGTSYTNTATTAGKTYYYKVKAIAEKSSADSACSEIKSRTCDLPRPDVSITRSSGKPKVSWNAVDGAVEYEVYRATSKSGTYSLIKTTTSLSYKDTEAVSGKTCYYKVVAVHSKSAANSASSSVVSIESR